MADITNVRLSGKSLGMLALVAVFVTAVVIIFTGYLLPKAQSKNKTVALITGASGSAAPAAAAPMFKVA